MTTEYRIRLDRSACEGIFACLVRDDRFREAADGLATLDGEDQAHHGEELTVSFSDDRQADAEKAARACPVGAIEISEGIDE